MRRRLAVAVVNVAAAIAHRLLDRIVMHTTCEHAEEPVTPLAEGWHLTPEEWRDYHLGACELTEHMADLRAAQHEADMEAWRLEYLARGESA